MPAAERTAHRWAIWVTRAGLTAFLLVVLLSKVPTYFMLAQEERVAWLLIAVVVLLGLRACESWRRVVDRQPPTCSSGNLF